MTGVNINMHTYSTMPTRAMVPPSLRDNEKQESETVATSAGIFSNCYCLVLLISICHIWKF